MNRTDATALLEASKTGATTDHLHSIHGGTRKALRNLLSRLVVYGDLFRIEHMRQVLYFTTQEAAEARLPSFVAEVIAESAAMRKAVNDKHNKQKVEKYKTHPRVKSQDPAQLQRRRERDAVRYAAQRAAQGKTVRPKMTDAERARRLSMTEEDLIKRRRMMQAAALARKRLKEGVVVIPRQREVSQPKARPAEKALSAWKAAEPYIPPNVKITRIATPPGRFDPDPDYRGPFNSVGIGRDEQTGQAW